MTKRLLLKTADELLDKTILFSYTNIGYQLRRPFWDRAAANVEGKVCLVTGANAGLGKVVAMELARRGAVVHMLCRSAERGAAAQQEIEAATGNGQIFLHQVDMSRQADIRAFVGGFEAEKVDVLVNNAGVLLPRRQVSDENIELTFATNVLGPFLLTELLLPKLQKAPVARVINVTSGGMYTARLHVDDLQFEKRPFNGPRAYAETKRAEVIMTQLWAQEWAGNGVAVHSVHPGWAATPGVARSLPRFDRIMRPLLRTSRQGADTILWLCVAPGLHKQPNGQLWFDRKKRPLHKRGIKRNSSAEIEKFWLICHQLTGVI